MGEAKNKLTWSTERINYMTRVLSEATTLIEILDTMTPGDLWDYQEIHHFVEPLRKALLNK